MSTPHWIFDLDNTLHDANGYVFPQMKQEMTAYIARHVGIAPEQAQQLHHHYWQHYGTTLAGLQRHHGPVDAAHFLRETHVLAALEQHLSPMRNLHRTLRQLPGRKFLFTNAPLAYARRVIAQLGIAHLFDAVQAIEHARLLPKPHAYGYRRLLQRHQLDPQRCIMVEDTPDNLRTAKQLGMRTVLLGERGSSFHFADLTIA
ncbi:pyrimidine 5'-nucleotidase, partial [Chitinimonas sp.]|uniref:pyrimidine 5'-nucleotidase n=1 Tax=Chitinimonas sp. TaxID=1934313 RepID=UPI0035B136C7